MIMADRTQEGTESTPKKRRPKLSLVPPIRTLDSPPISSPTLSPSTDLSLLLSDTKLRSRYKEGRYKPGTNAARKLRYFPTHLSHISSLIAKDCTPKSSSAVVVCAALHIGVLDMLEWPSVISISETYNLFVSSTPTLKEDTVYQVENIFQEQPPDLPSHQKVIILSELIDDDLKRLSAATRVSTTTLASIACILTLTSQASKYSHSGIVSQLRASLSGFRFWLRWKAKKVGEAIEYFEKDSLEEE